MIRYALDPSGLNNPVSNYSRHIDRYVLSALLWCAAALPSDGQLLTDNDLAGLNAQLRDLRELIETASLPTTLIHFFLHHVRILEDALRNYKVRGPTAFVTAHVSAVQHIAVNHGLIERHKDDIEVRAASKRLADVWEWIEERVQDIETSHKALTYVAAGAAAVNGAAPHLLPIISGIANQLK